MRCRVCRDFKMIRLPLYPDAVVASGPDFEPPAAVECPYRDYPCPECSVEVPVSRVHLAREIGYLDIRYASDERARSALRASLIVALARRLDESGAIISRTLRGDGLRQSMVVELGVVSSEIAGNLERVVAARQEEFAGDVANEAVAQIVNWGSASSYGSRTIEKSRAVDFVREAIGVVRERRSDLPSPRTGARV